MSLTRHALAAALALLLGPVVLAGSLGTSSAVGGSSASVGSSASSDASSASSGGAKAVAEGPYRIIDVATVPGQPESLRLTLQAQAAGGDPAATVHLRLPQATVSQARLAVGQTVLAQARPYGLAFARADAAQPFFLVLDDAWHGELPARPVGAATRTTL